MAGIRHPYLAGASRLGLAHRGGAKEAPENSRAAFRHARALGMTHIETDVRATADGILVVHHDATLDRTTDRTGLIAEMPYVDVREARVGGEPIMTLDEALEDFADLRLNIDVKDDHSLAPLVRYLRRAGEHLFDRILVGSFSQARLRHLRWVFGPRLATSAGPTEVAALKAAAAGAPVPVPPPSVVAAQVPLRYKGVVPVVSPAFVEVAHSRGLAVHVWTVDDDTQMRDLFTMGVDGIVTDRPTVLREVLAERIAS